MGDFRAARPYVIWNPSDSLPPAATVSRIGNRFSLSSPYGDKGLAKGENSAIVQITSAGGRDAQICVPNEAGPIEAPSDRRWLKAFRSEQTVLLMKSPKGGITTDELIFQGPVTLNFNCDPKQFQEDYSLSGEQ